MKLFKGLFFFCSIITLSTIALQAGPTIIRDNRITDLAVTPVLGRGYSVSTNTYQSTCLKDVILTEPSYDMKYRFYSAEDEGQYTRSSSNSNSRSRTSSYSSNGKSGFWGWSSNGSYSSKYKLDTSSKTTVVDNVTWYNHDIFVSIDLYSYYASIDESKTKMSEAAITLLQNNDIPGFFAGCGPYYVRSIGRKAQYISRFSYRTRSNKRDSSFESKLKSEIQSFSTRSKKGWFSKGSSTSNRTDKQEQEREYNFSREASSKRLTILSRAYGLGKNEKATLIAHDLETFKASLKDAFLSMQNIETGKVAHIEVVPWVENTEFQSLVDLEKSDDETKPVLDKDGNQVIGPDGKPQVEIVKKGKMLYEKKETLNINAEFFMEVTRADRNLMNMYYKAKLCRRNIDMNWKDGDKFKEGYEDRNVINHRTDAVLPLKELDQVVSKSAVDGLLQKEKEFMYGASGSAEGSEKSDKKTGAAACIKKIMDSGIYEKRYMDHDECQDVIEKMGNIQNDTIENYCMPALAD